MYNIADLFDKRSVVGAKLEQTLSGRAYTKAKLCKDSGVSRPTLDKILSGTITNKTNYEKHITKLLTCLSLTPDMLLSNVHNPYNKVSALRDVVKISSESISSSTKISTKRLKEIEAGSTATTAELRDIAFHLFTSVRSVLGTNFFATPIALIHDIVTDYNDEKVNGLSGFWGHIGILPENSDNYLWFPISADTRKQIYNSIDLERIVVPCMNNKLLYINMQNIKEITLLDDACDPPVNANWDYTVDCGEIPLVVYEALEDYYEYDKESLDADRISPDFYDCINNIVESKEWSEDKVYEFLNMTVVHYKDGTVKNTDIYFDENESISSEISDIYSFGDTSCAENILFYNDFNGAKRFINMNNISVMEIPLLKIEDAICKCFDEIMED